MAAVSFATREFTVLGMPRIFYRRSHSSIGSVKIWRSGDVKPLRIAQGWLSLVNTM